VKRQRSIRFSKIIIEKSPIRLIGFICIAVLIFYACDLGEDTETTDFSLNGDTNISRSDLDVSKEFIYLKKRNWENHGTDVRIYNEGMFVVTQESLGKSMKVREGTLSLESPDELDDLMKSIENANLFGLEDEYEGPFKTQYNWWGYQLTVNIDQGSKCVRFHSEDETVPDSLMDIVEKIRDLTTSVVDE